MTPEQYGRVYRVLNFTADTTSTRELIRELMLEINALLGYAAPVEKIDLATAIEHGIKLARGVSTGRPDGAYFTVLGPEGIHASVLGLAALGAGQATVEQLVKLYDHQRDAYAREVLAQFPAEQRGGVIDWSSLGGASPWEVVARLRGKYGIRT